MKIEIKSREEIENITLPGNTALISITDVGWTFATLKNQPDYLLQIAFDDVDDEIFLDAEKYHMLTDEQAKQIVDFYAKIKDKADTLICQCEHGQSRSAAIAAAILEYESKCGIDIFINDNYYPNKTIFKKIFKQLKEGISK